MAKYKTKGSKLALSTMAAEYIAGCEGVKNLLWLKWLFNELGELRDTPELCIDNKGSIKLTKNLIFHNRSKHIEIRYHFMREKFLNGAIGVEYVPTNSQTAIIMTKAILPGHFEELKIQLGMMKRGLGIQRSLFGPLYWFMLYRLS